MEGGKRGLEPSAAGVRGRRLQLSQPSAWGEEGAGPVSGRVAGGLPVTCRDGRWLLEEAGTRSSRVPRQRERMPLSAVRLGVGDSGWIALGGPEAVSTAESK